ncbi:MAG: EndoU domain-containing protein [Anaplasma ovis]
MVRYNIIVLCLTGKYVGVVTTPKLFLEIIMRASNITTLISVFCACAGAHPFLALSGAADNPSSGDRYTLGEDMLEKGKEGGNANVLATLHVNDCRHGNAGFNPFFKTEADDMCKLPHAPQMRKFDEAILGMCGDWGYIPSERDFLNVLDGSYATGAAQRIYDELNHEVFTADADFALFKEELAELWFGGNGAANVFCGVPSSEELRGMHFYGRYLEAQDKQWAGRNYDGLENADDWDFAPSIRFVIPDGGVSVSNKEEVEVDFSHADDIIIRATKAYKGLAPNLLYDEGKLCFYKSDDGHVYALVAAKDAIITFYPTMAPDPICASGANTVQCDCMNYLEGGKPTLRGH